MQEFFRVVYDFKCLPDTSELKTISSKGKHRSQKVLNALILLACDEGSFQLKKSVNEDIAAVLGVSMRKIDRLKNRFVEEGLNIALNGTKGQRAYAKKADGDLEAHVVALSCNPPPEGHVRWSLRLLADKVVELKYIESISHETIRQVLKKTNSSLGKRSAGSSLRKGTPSS